MKQVWVSPELKLVTFSEDVVTASTVSDTYYWIGTDDNACREGGITQ